MPQTMNESQLPPQRGVQANRQLLVLCSARQPVSCGNAAKNLLRFDRKAGRKHGVEYGSLVLAGAIVLHLDVQLRHPNLSGQRAARLKAGSGRCEQWRTQSHGCRASTHLKAGVDESAHIRGDHIRRVAASGAFAITREV